VRHLAYAPETEAPQALGAARWKWNAIQRILIIRLRSIGDTVLSTSALFALRRFSPQAQIEILVEDWVAPVLERSDLVDRIITIPRDSKVARARLARELRRARYDLVYNLHGGTTATFLTRATRAPHRVGFNHYQYARLHNHLAPLPAQLWQRPAVHCVEQQLALIGWTGVPVTDRPRTRLTVTDNATQSVSRKLRRAGFEGFDERAEFAVIHPGAAFDTKRWDLGKFVQVASELFDRSLMPIMIVAEDDAGLLESARLKSSGHLVGLKDLSLPEVTALASRARVFVGNDSGIAHIAAASGAPCVVIFGSSNVAHWRPWTTVPSEIVREELPCQPCPGYFCGEFEKPECILRVPVERVVGAIDRVLRATAN